MAKMFYNLEETAELLGTTTEQVKKMVQEGKLQQFRDRDKLMFKRDQVDEMADMRDTIKIGETAAGETGELQLDDTVDALSTKTDKIELISDDAGATDTGSSYELVLEEEGEAKAKTGDTDLVGEDFAGKDKTSAMGLADDDATQITATPPADKPKGKGKPPAGKAETSPISLADTGGPGGTAGGTDAMDAMEVDDLQELNLEEEAAKSRGPAASGTRTGVNIFDTQEIDAADSMARTQVTRAFKEEEEDLNIESVGSGSGLLDLTREADDTSLGAVELLDEVAPAGETAAGGTVGGTIGGSMPGSSTGIFEGASETEGATSGSIVAVDEAVEGEPEMVTSYAVAEEPDVFGGLTLAAVFAFLVITSIVAVTGMRGQIIKLTDAMVAGPEPQNRLYLFVIIFIVLGIILFAVDFVLDRKRR